MNRMKICIVYDRVNKWGGAEQVLLSLHEIWPDAPLYTAVYDSQKATWANPIDVRPSFLNHLPLIKQHHEWFPNAMPYAFENMDLSQYDVIISVTSAEAKGVITGPNQLHICYLLTPTRYLWSHADEYAGSGLTGWIRRQAIKSLKAWDLVAASRPDKMIAISQSVAKRSLDYYHRTVDAVIYPPVDVDFFANHPTSCSKPKPGYLLTVSRLVPYKKVDLAINACNELQQSLIVVGEGNQQPYLQRIAGPTIQFMGQITKDELACLYHHADGFLFPQEEEFGISAIEAQAAGLPVVAFNKGSAPELIVQGKTGIFFSEQTVPSLKTAIQTLKSHTWYDKTIQEHVQQYHQSVFKKHIEQFVEGAWKQIHV
jgi:glycosyltransferase involved in cell wall biosynthesis